MEQLNSVDYQPDIQLTEPNVNITNVLCVDPLELAKWTSVKLLNLRLPVPGPNNMLNIYGEVMPLMATITNRISFATELYVQCAGAKPAYTKMKKDPATKATAEDALAIIGSHLDVLYRAIQTLEAMREAASRMITGSNNAGRIFNGG